MSTEPFWHFEAPINLTATVNATLTWEPNTFDTAGLGNFSCNIWLLRADDPSDSDFVDWPPVILAGRASLAPFA
jgi:hypothetical protein